MRAKHHTTCHICQGAVRPGEDIEVYLKEWTHLACKAEDIARRTAEVAVLQGVTEIPMEYEPAPQLVASNNRIQHRRANRSKGLR